jgi:hypothetical protein
MFRFKKKKKLIDVTVTALAIIFSLVVMFYGIFHFGLSETWLEPILDIFYVACLVMMWMYSFNHLDAQRFNYWCSGCVGVTILLRDILFIPELASLTISLICLTLSVLLLQMLTFFYARKNWKSYTKGNLWLIFIIDVIIASLYHYDIRYLEPVDEYTDYYLIEIWIRPTITYGLVACFISEREKEEQK